MNIDPLVSNQPLRDLSTGMPMVSLTVDIVPILLALTAALCVLSLVVMVWSGRMARDKGAWALGSVLAILGLLLIVLRATLSPLLSILVGNIALLCGETLIAVGAARYAGRRTIGVGAIGLAAVVSFALSYQLGASVAERAIVYAVSCAALSASAARSFFRTPRSWANWGAGGSAAVLCGIEGSRAVLLYASLLTPGDKTAMNGFSVVLGVAFSTLLAGSLVALSWRSVTQAAATRRAARALTAAEAPPSGAEAWIINTESQSLIAPDGCVLRLTANECLVLQKLGEVGGLVDRLALNALIGRSALDPKDRAIDILFSRLRRKCADQGLNLPVNALRGRGYVFLGDLQLQ